MTNKKETNNNNVQTKKKNSSNAKNAKRRKKKQQQRIIIISGVVILIAVIAVLIKVFAGGSAYDTSKERNVDLSSTTITDMVKDTSKEAEKGPEKTSGKTVYITIDDGPSQYTDRMLKILDKYNAKATFFMVDTMMRKYPQQVKNVSNSTSTAGFHSVTHDIKQLYKSTDAAKNEFDQCSKTYTELTGKKSKVIRIPFGSKPYTPEASYNKLIAAGYQIWDWNVDTNDWRGNSAQIMNVVKQYGNGHNVVILMHEKPQTLEAFDSLIKYYADNGYEFAAIGQNEKPRNFWLQNLSLN